MDMRELEQETDAVRQSVVASRILADALARHDRENRRLWALVVALVIAIACMAGAMIYVSSHAQAIANEAMLNALETVAEIEVSGSTTTTTTTVEQDSGEGSGNNVYLSGEHATYDEGADE